MKKFILVLSAILIFQTCSVAGNLPHCNYKNIKIKSKISYNSSADSWDIGKKSDIFFVKTKGFGLLADYLKDNGDFAFTTNCEYEFIKDGKFIGYSGKDLTFYEFSYKDGILTKTPLVKEEIQILFPEYRIIALSEFSKNTNSIKIRKKLGSLNIFLFNDTDKEFEDYKFTSGNAKFETYPISGLITVHSAGMIQFAKDGEHTSANPWYVILVR